MKKILEGSENYAAKVIEVKEWRKHENADKLFIINVDFNNVITGVEPKKGDRYVYFPVLSIIDEKFIKYINGYSDATLNENTEVKGFFSSKPKVKPIKLRGEKSEGYLHPLEDVEKFYNVSLKVGDEFNTINGIEVCKKFLVKAQNKENVKQGKSPKISRVIDGQVHLHISTPNLRKEVFKLSPDDLISITDKTHGTSWWVSNVLVKKSLKWWEKLLVKAGVDVNDTEYDVIYGSRSVVKNGYLDTLNSGYYGYDIWGEIKELVKDKIPKGFTLYGECLGYLKTGGEIQKGYDYGCAQGEFKIEVYRITYTNVDGQVFELSYPEISEFCNRMGLVPSKLIYSGKAKDLYPEISVSEHWNENFLKQLELDFLEKYCDRCKNKVFAEGIVVRVENLFSCLPYKLKSFNFLLGENKEQEKGLSNIEDEQ